MDNPTIQAAVWHAADQLFAAGIRPTVANVREITKRGSAGTINQALKDWWRDLSSRVSSRERRPDVPEPVADAMCRLWATSLDRAEHALLAYREDADRQVTEAKALLVTAEKSRGQADIRCRMLEEQLAALQLSSAELQRNLAAETALRKESDSRIRSIREEAAKVVAEMHASLMRMEKQCEMDKEHYQTMERNLTGQADETRLMRQQAEKRLADFQADAASMEQAYRTEVVDHKERCARQSERSALLEQRIGKLELELDQALERIHTLISENTMLRKVSSQAPGGARISARLKASRAKKRRF
jgi:chromosome segregation ATPase